MNPIRIQRSRQQKQISPNGLPIKYVGRGSAWGNPFKVVKTAKGDWIIDAGENPVACLTLRNHGKSTYATKQAAAIDAVKCYDYWLLPYRHAHSSMREFYQSMAEIEDLVQQLRGFNLSCWCKADEVCHADYLLKMANP